MSVKRWLTIKKITVLERILCVFKPKKSHDILTEAENIINQYINKDMDFVREKSQSKLGTALNIAIICSALVLAYLVFVIIK